MKKTVSLGIIILIAVMAQAQFLNPVKFSSQLKTNGTAEAEIIFSGHINSGWHVYSTGLGADGPISATFNVNKLDGVELVGKLTARGNEISNYDKLFEMKLRYFENNVQFVQKVKFTKPSYNISAYLEYGACNDKNCLPPTSVDISKSGKSPATAASTSKTNDASAAAKKALLLAAANGAPEAKAALAKIKADSIAQTLAQTTPNGEN